MKDYLFDIVKYVSVLPFEIARVTGTEEKTLIQSNISHDSVGSVILFATTKEPVKDLKGVFGVDKFGMLGGLTSFPAFKDQKATVSMKTAVKKDKEYPAEIVFENKGNAKASFRLIHEQHIPSQMKHVSDIKWNAVVESVNKSKVMDLVSLSGIYASQESRFSVKLEDGKLKILIGEENSADHKAEYILAEGVAGELKTPHKWNIGGVLGVLKLSAGADVTLKISNLGILQVTVDSGLALYEYVFGGFEN